MRRPAIAALIAAAGAAALGVPATADQPPEDRQPAVTIKAEGNAFTGGLRFNPAAVSVKVGDLVRWVNTDTLVPHTATEDHGLWDLAGDYGATPANPPGFGPGETRERIFAAGDWSYYCRVHGKESQSGKVSVPVTLVIERARRRARGGKRRTVLRVVAIWATEKLPEGQVFDVQRKGAGDWATIRNGTRDLKGTFAGGKRGTSWSFRARLRKSAKPEDASGYSPEATVKVK